MFEEAFTCGAMWAMLKEMSESRNQLMTALGFQSCWTREMR